MVTTAGPVYGSASGASALPTTESPTVLRIVLGGYLRRLREANRISLDEAGDVLRASRSKVSKLETGRVGFKDRDITDLLTLYGVTDEEERQTLRSIAVRAGSPGWWHDYADVMPSWFDEYVGLELAASDIRAYELQFIPGLLQTEDYARAVIMIGYSNPKEIRRRVDLRMARQAKVLDSSHPPALRMVLDEASLSRPLGGRAVLRTQLRHLIEMASRPNVTVQVMPFQVGGHAGAGSSFSLLSFEGFDLPDVVYLEQLTSAQCHDKPAIVKGYEAVMDRMCAEALSPTNSVKTLRSMLRDA